MAKFHLSEKGPAICKDSVRAFPVGGEHFDTLKDAEKAYGDNKDTFNNLSKSSKSLENI